ncbi:GntR family transcriptional regulator [Leekyejoonella antrihumi]|uniref:GntR family transcriptional regulator n=1 Tax=Leekyejoonella antrihumi TaxID=1660198 RepID=UPI001C94535F|nr:GntR family transcriptional regulator [Leekyejoonella antrihumi]
MASTAREPAREPKHYAVRRHLLELIESMEPGSAVPTERSLAADLRTSRTTVRQALVDLVAEGRLTRRQGSGTYVAESKITWPLHLASFTEQAAANGLTASSELLGTARVRADSQTAERLQINRGDPVYRIDRLRLADHLPTAVETSVLSAERFPGLTRRMRTAGSLHALLTMEYGVDLRRGEESIEIAPASPREATLLRIDASAAMLVVRRHSFDAHGAPVEWGTSSFRGDRICLIANLGIPPVRRKMTSGK